MKYKRVNNLRVDLLKYKKSMHLQGFNLEILVNEQPLPEYNLPINESNLKNTSISYVTDSLTQTKKHSDFTTYVPVITPGERYTVKFEAKQAKPSNIIISRIFIDGQSDQVQHLHQQSGSRTRSFFFPFPIIKKSSIQQQQKKNTYGKPGSITVCFFKGIIVDQDALQSKTKFEIKQVKFPETTDIKNIEIGYTTGFDAMHAKIQPATVTKIVNLKPIAVLHLHYRSVDWFTNKRLSLPILNFNQEKKDVTNNNENTKESQEIIQVESNDNVKQLKRNYEEISKDILNEKECNNILKKLC
ncbi:glycoside hydrolase family 20 protein [Rhizophagus irregularis DAOM 181602=DAOM 197198]|nr:glycoside hydrolase family 20 protein [Rhizophagus irregularis DAOM 181602=DAOM 197198]